jgi:hypothetical protein
MNEIYQCQNNWCPNYQKTWRVELQVVDGLAVRHILLCTGCNTEPMRLQLSEVTL